ncbi:MAG: 50S ribosomal protein L15 [Candidatus Peregrinibacteria bacterium]
MLHQLKPAPGSIKKHKRIARGIAAGGGKTAGRGTKGQHARVGKGQRFGFEGGQTPLIRRQPKLKGFRHPAHKEYEVLSLDTLSKRLEAGHYDIAALKASRLVHARKPVKILAGTAPLTKKFALSVHAVSASAKEAIVKAGGSVTIIR